MEKQNSIPSSNSIKVRHLTASRQKYASRSRKDLCTPFFSFRSKVPLTGLTTLKNFYSQYKQDEMPGTDFLKHFACSPPFCRHTRIEQVNTFSKESIRKDSLFMHSKVRGRFHESQPYIDEQAMVELVHHVLSNQTKQIVTEAYEEVRATCKGFGVTGMVLLFGVQLYMVFSNYAAASELLHELLLLILQSQQDEYLVVYLRLKILTLSNLNQNTRAIGYLKKLLRLSLLFQLQDIQMWCYHNLSKLFLVLHQLEYAKLMMDKFQQGIFEGNSKNRPVYIESIQEEIDNMKRTKSDFQLESDDLDVKLLRNRMREPQTEPTLKEIKYMAIQMSREKKDSRIFRVLPKIFRERVKNKEEEDMQIQLMMTHLSKIKNFNTYFRETSNPLNVSWDFITIENPALNWPVLREIARKICIEYLGGRLQPRCEVFSRRRP